MAPGPPPLSNRDRSVASPTTEQEDHDLALAFQIQEDEEDANRRSQTARRREDDLSRRYLSREPPTPPIPGQSDARLSVPPRRSGPGESNVNTGVSQPRADD